MVSSGGGGGGIQPTQRSAIFLVGCLGVRLALALSAKYVAPKNDTYRTVLAGFGLVVGLGMLAHFVLGTRATAPEAGGVVWWNVLRPVHAALWILYAVYALKGEHSVAWPMLMADTALGLLSWYTYRVRGCPVTSMFSLACG